jgi:predicted Zn-dependent peptidase
MGRIGIASMMLGYRCPTPRDPSFPAVLVLAQVIEGRSGLLLHDRELLRTLAESMYGLPYLAGKPLDIFTPEVRETPQFAFYVQTSPSTLSAIQRALERMLAPLRQGLISETSLQRAQHAALNKLALEGLGPVDRATTVGEWMLFAGGLEDLREFPDKLEAVTAADVQAAAVQVFSTQYVGLQLPE